MLSTKVLSRTFIFMGILSWILWAASALTITFGKINNLPWEMGQEIPKIFFLIYLAFLFLFYRFKIENAENVKFTELLWKVLITGLITILTVLLINSLFFVLGQSYFVKNLMAVNFFYLISAGLISAFVISTFIVWKKLILYQKTRKLIIYWRVFEYGLMVSLSFLFFDFRVFDFFFNVSLLVFILMGIALSFNLKWIAYLNFKQKLMSLSILLITLAIIWYLAQNLNNFSAQYELQLDVLSSITFLALLAFIFVYALISTLVILFNLPTTSVFEQKMSEVVNFQRLSQSIQQGYSPDKVYEILLDSAINAVFANAAWLEIYDDNGEIKQVLQQQLNSNKIESLKREIDNTKLKKYIKDNELMDINPNKLSAALKDPDFRSVVVMPLVVKDRIAGRLVLFKDVTDGFNKEMVDIINSFVNQACISLENLQLLSEALETERYREELKIAAEVHKNLLPNINNTQFNGFDLAAFSYSADEVGGDYYDVFSLADGKTVIIIGDVSGKGTSAAFQMAQMKGVFHSLAQLGLSPKQFFMHTNDALSRCLNSKTFITASYYVIDPEAKTVRYARAGHCPTIFYENEKDNLRYLKTAGMALGMLRDPSYVNFIEEKTIYYQPNDVILLYTDGIIEARNEEDEEYGYKKLGSIVEQHAKGDVNAILKAVQNDLHAFCTNHELKDDYSAVAIKFDITN